MNPNAKFAVMVGEKFLGKMTTSAPLGPVNAAQSYSWTREEADQVAAVHAGVVVTAPRFDAAARRYIWSAV